MISVAEALERLFALVEPTVAEAVKLQDAAGRVLSEDVSAGRNQPPFAASAMDGYAMRRADLAADAELHVIGTVAAGDSVSLWVGPGEAVRIFTGAAIPDQADFVLMQEDASRNGEVLRVAPTFVDNDFIRPAGGDFKKGETVSAHARLAPNDIALLAAMNHGQVRVARKPTIALLPTGDELVWPGDTPDPTQIIASNNFGLKALLEAQGAEVILLPIARDNPDSLTAAFQAASGADLLVTLGGASVGDKDLIRKVGVDAGLELDFYKIAMRPGKPLMAGQLNGMAMIGLPGNPVSAMVCGQVFLRPLVDAMLGLPARALLRQKAFLEHDLGSNGAREHYMRANVTEGVCRVFERQDSSLLSVLARANALAIRPPNDPVRKAGAEIEYISL